MRCAGRQERQRWQVFSSWERGRGRADLEGKVQTIVIADRMVVLEDGKQVWIAEGLSMDELKEGAQVKVVYEERDGKLVATSVEIVK